MQPECPECKRLNEVRDEYNLIAEFLEYLQDKGVVLTTYNKNVDMFFRVADTDNELIADYFGIDMAEVETERQELLKWLQEDWNEQTKS